MPLSRRGVGWWAITGGVSGDTGLFRSNLLSMRAFAEAYPDDTIVQQLVGQLPWGHNVLLLTKLKDAGQCDWYAHQTLAHGWSQAVLTRMTMGSLLDLASQVEEADAMCRRVAKFLLSLPALS